MTDPDDRGRTLSVRRVGRRRVTTAPAPGSDAKPQAAAVVALDQHAARAAEDTDAAWGDTPDTNESRLTADRPPHY